MMGEQRNLVVAIVLSAVIIFAWQFFWDRTHPVVAPPPTPAATATPQETAPPAAGAPAAPGQPVAAPAAAAPQTRAEALAAAPRIKIVTPSLDGTISLRGARLDDLTLAKYRETPDPASPPITLLSPPVGNSGSAYFAEFGWVAGADAVPLPGRDTLWSTNSARLTPDQPVTLTWDNGSGLRFTRTYAVDANYMFTVTESVENTADKPVTLYPYGLVTRWGTPATLNYYILHEGALGVLGGTLKEEKYKALRTDDHLVQIKSHGGWIGFTDKYWLTALVPDQRQDVSTRMSWHDEGGLDRYQTDWTGAGVTVAPGGSGSATSHLFAGAKVLALLDAYGQALDLPRFDRAIDFGWFFFLTIPLFKFLRFIHEHVANFGLAIMVFTVCVRAAFFPIANRSFQAMNKMKKLQPEIKKLQARFADDRAKLNQEMMALYKREKANPVSGCLPLVIQIPVFFALYKVLFVTIEMRQAPFWGWINDLSSPDPTTIFNLFGLIPWDPPAMLHIGVWPLIMGITMFLQQKLNPQPPDPIQARMFAILPVVFTFLLAKFPAGLVIYWSWSNTLSILQQWLITRRVNRTR